MSASFADEKSNLIADYEKTIKVLKRQFGDAVIVAVTIGIVAASVIGYCIVYPALKKVLG